MGRLPLITFFNVLARRDLIFSKKFLGILEVQIFVSVLTILKIRLYFTLERFKMSFTYMIFLSTLNVFFVGIILNQFFKCFLYPYLVCQSLILFSIFYYQLVSHIGELMEEIKAHLFTV